MISPAAAAAGATSPAVVLDILENHRVQVLEKIGEGAFGVVHRATLDLSQDICVKVRA